MLGPGGQEIYASGFNGAMPQYIGQLHNIPCGPVEGGGKQVPQIMREYFGGRDPGQDAQPFHVPPDLAAGQALSVFGEKNFAGDGFLLFGIFEQLPAQFSGG